MKKQKINKNNKFDFWQFVKQYRIPLLIYVLIFLVAGGIDIFITIKFANFIELITLSNFNLGIKSLIIIGIFYVTQQLLYIFNGLLYNRIYVNVTNNMSVSLSEQCFKITSSSYTRHNTASFMQRISSDPNTIFQNLQVIINYITEIITSSIMVIYISVLNKYIGLIIVATVLFGSIVEKIRRKKRVENRREVRQCGEKIDSLLNEIVRSERDIKSLNLEQPLKDRTATVYDDYKKKYLKMQMTDWSLWGSVNTMIRVISVVILLLAVQFMDLGLMTLASFMIVYSNRYAMFDLVRTFGNISNCFAEIKVAKGRIDQLFENKEYQLEKFGHKGLTNIKGKIKFDKVYFGYKLYKEKESKEFLEEVKYNKKHKIKKKVDKVKYLGKKEVLKNISFEIKPNTTIAFVGKSGSGKSTILNLISKINECDKGLVTLDGVDIKKLNKETIRSAISLVNQFPYIFDMSIRENLLLAKPDATEKEIQAAIHDSALDEFVDTLPDGLETLVGESGIKLSGGQKQRLAIARAMLRKSSIIIFDESTSSLDNIAQNQIKKSIDNIKGKSTVVIVAHRLTTIKNVDRIYFLNKGEIVDEGTFEELYKRNKEFKEIFLAENIK